MKLKHVCDIGWMRARQEFLTASDIRTLLPVTATGRPRKVGDDQRLKVFASKLPFITADDCVSTGAAARGHILEPFAIEEFNLIYSPSLHHWDDLVVAGSKPGLKVQPAFSPDALNVLMPKAIGTNIFSEERFFDDLILGEVKCYSHERHIASVFTNKKDMEERWQIAMAMYVSERIAKGYLILFDPSISSYQLGVHMYDRSDLENEISVVEQVVLDYNDFIRGLPDPRALCFSGDKLHERQIMEKYRQYNELNP